MLIGKEAHGDTRGSLELETARQESGGEVGAAAGVGDAAGGQRKLKGLHTVALMS